MAILKIIPALLLSAAAANPLAAQSSFTFSLGERGGLSVTTTGAVPELQVGYVRMNPAQGQAAGFALYGLRQNGALVSEVTIPAAGSFRAGRVHVETGGAVNTGIALANQHDEAIQIAAYFTESNGTPSASTVFEIAAKAQLARFFTEAPFNVAANFRGTLTFFTLSPRPDLNLASIALRGYTNQRGEFLMTSVPVIPIDERGFVTSDMLPHFAAGGGWSTEVVLVNATDSELGGIVAFVDQAGRSLAVEAEGKSSGVFDYRVLPRSSWSLKTSTRGALRVGSVRVGTAVPGMEIPTAFLVFSFEAADGTTITTGGVPASPLSAASRLFVESSGRFAQAEPGSLQTGIAVANPSAAVAANVTLELTALDGSFTGFRSSFTIVPGGQIAKFLYEIPGFEAIPSNFQGVLRISASSPVSTIGLRARYNERREFLMTTLVVVNESDPFFESVLRYSNFVFPHFVNGAGYTTKFVLFSGWTPGAASGNLEFFSSAGSPIPVPFQ